jgi:hypothetical protein
LKGSPFPAVHEDLKDYMKLHPSVGGYGWEDEKGNFDIFKVKEYDKDYIPFKEWHGDLDNKWALDVTYPYESVRTSVDIGHDFTDGVNETLSKAFFKSGGTEESFREAVDIILKNTLIEETGRLDDDGKGPWIHLCKDIIDSSKSFIKCPGYEFHDRVKKALDTNPDMNFAAATKMVMSHVIYSKRELEHMGPNLKYYWITNLHENVSMPIFLHWLRFYNRLDQIKNFIKNPEKHISEPSYYYRLCFDYNLCSGVNYNDPGNSIIDLYTNLCNEGYSQDFLM